LQGHLRYPIDDVPPDHTRIYVNLGALDTYKAVIPVDLSPYVSPNAYSPQSEADFLVEVSSLNGDQSTHIVQLPVMEDLANLPFCFTTLRLKDFKLVFKIYRAEPITRKNGALLGCAIAVLNNLRRGLGPRYESLIRNFTIPILQKDTLSFMGSLTFYFLAVTPFPYPQSKGENRQRIDFGNPASPTVIGHRGRFHLVILGR